MALLATTLLAACSKVPDGILSEKKMQGVLTDMLLAEAMVNVDYNTYKSDTMKLALYESVFRKHDITQAVYDSSLVWYGRNLDIYMEVYNRVLADLNKRINNLGDVQADAAPVSNRDSVDIWPRRSYLVLSPTSVFNGVTFDIRPETNYSSGSSFVLGMRVWGLNNKMAYKPEVRLSADQGDTTLTVNSKITKDGYHETILKTIPTKKVKRVFGYIRMDNIRPETNYSSGSSFVLGMRVWGLNNKMAYKPEVRLSADQGDTTLTVNSKITKDGYHETILKTIPTKKVKRVFGYIRMDNMDTTYYKVYIDSLSLMKYNYGKELAELPKDSIK